MVAPLENCVIWPLLKNTFLCAGPEQNILQSCREREDGKVDTLLKTIPCHQNRACPKNTHFEKFGCSFITEGFGTYAHYAHPLVLSLFIFKLKKMCGDPRNIGLLSCWVHNDIPIC